MFALLSVLLEAAKATSVKGLRDRVPGRRHGGSSRKPMKHAIVAPARINRTGSHERCTGESIAE
jgi:hypothetical protein